MLKLGTKDNSNKSKGELKQTHSINTKLLKQQKNPANLSILRHPKKFITHLMMDQVMMISSRTQTTNLRSIELLYQLLNSKVLQTKLEVSWTKTKQLLAKKWLTLICRFREFSSLSKILLDSMCCLGLLSESVYIRNIQEWRYKPHEALQPLVESFYFLIY